MTLEMNSGKSTYHDHIVAPPGGEIVEPTREVGRSRESLWGRRLESEQLLHVKDLYAMVRRLFEVLISSMLR